MMAGAAVGYTVFTGLVGWVLSGFAPFFLAAFAIYAAVIAVPLLSRGPVRFTIACWTMAAFVLVLGFILAAAGTYLLWPAVLPLALAGTPLPEVRHPWPLICVSVVVCAAPIVFFTLVDS